MFHCLGLSTVLVPGTSSPPILLFTRRRSACCVVCGAKKGRRLRQQAPPNLHSVLFVYSKCRALGNVCVGSRLDGVCTFECAKYNIHCSGGRPSVIPSLQTHGWSQQSKESRRRRWLSTRLAPRLALLGVLDALPASPGFGHSTILYYPLVLPWLFAREAACSVSASASSAPPSALAFSPLLLSVKGDVGACAAGAAGACVSSASSAPPPFALAASGTFDGGVGAPRVPCRRPAPTPASVSAAGSAAFKGEVGRAAGAAAPYLPPSSRRRRRQWLPSNSFLHLNRLYNARQLGRRRMVGEHGDGRPAAAQLLPPFELAGGQHARHHARQDAEAG